MPSILIKIEGLHTVRVIEIDTTDTIQVLAPNFARLTHLEPAVTALANAIGCKQRPGVVSPTVEKPAPETRVPVQKIASTPVVANTDTQKPTQPEPTIPTSIFRGRAN